MPPAPLFGKDGNDDDEDYKDDNGGIGGTAASAAINFTSLAPPPGGAHSSVPNNAFLPPPTPVASPSFPQQLSASSQHLLLRHADAIPTLISLLTNSPSRQVYEQAVWILGSIAAGDAPHTASDSSKSVSARDVILAAGVMNPLLRCLENHPSNLSLQRIGSWTLSNLVDGIFQQQQHGKNSSTTATSSAASNTAAASTSGNGVGTGSNSNNSKDYSSADEIDMPLLLPVLRRLLHMSDSEVLSYTCWTLSHLCDGPSSHIAAVVTSTTASAPPGGLVPRLVELLTHASWRVTKPALRTIGNIVCAECSDPDGITATQDYTEVILECHAVPRLQTLITHVNREIQKEACWTLSNIAAGTIDQIQSVIDSGAIPPLVRLVQDGNTDQEVRSEACWVVLNATSCGSDSQIELLVDEGCVSVLGVLLSEASMVMMALEGLERVLQVEETREFLRREQQQLLKPTSEPTPAATDTLVSAALIEKARDSHNASSAVTKRAERIWKQHFVSCALCKKSFSKHRAGDASFCEECKCYVCCNCNCRIYHLDYQEELWAATEEKTVAKKNAKKSKNKKRKEKLKQKKANKQQQDPNDKETSITEDVCKEAQKSGNSEKSTVETNNSKDTSVVVPREDTFAAPPKASSISPSNSFDDDDEDDDVEQDHKIDFVLYLQQTGSILALAKLMDALEYGGEVDDYERKMIREQQNMVSNQVVSSS